MNNGHILVIDDDKGFVSIMQDILAMEDYSVTGISEPEGLQCASLVKQVRPHLVILDYCLGNINGGSLCHELNSDPETCHLPLILISAYPEAYLPLKSIPFTVFIPKPFDVWQFLPCIKELLQNRANQLINE